MSLDESLEFIIRAIQAGITEGQTDDDVSVDEYNQLVDMQSQALRLKRKRWARKTFKEQTK